MSAGKTSAGFGKSYRRPGQTRHTALFFAEKMTSPTKKLLLIPVSLLAIVSAILYFGITIPLGFVDDRLESLAGRLLDREVAIEESARLTISLHPALTFGGVSIANPRNWQGDSHFVIAEKGKGRVDLVSLLKGSIRLEELELEGVDLRFVTRANHDTNILFTSSDKKSAAGTSSHEFTGLDHVSLRDIRVSYLDELSGKEYILTVDSARGRGMPGRPLMFSAEGTFLGLAYSLAIAGGSLHDLVQGGEPWPLRDGELTLGDIILDLSGAIGRNVEGGAGFADLFLSGGNLGELGKILGFSIPDMGDFSVDARIGLGPGMLHVTQLALAAMGSSLHGDLALSLQGERPTLSGNITVPSLDPRLIAKLKSGDSHAKNVDVPKIITEGRLPWEMLNSMDADLHLLVENIIGDPLRVEPMRAVVSLVNGDLILPFSVTAMNTPMGGRMEVFTNEEIPEINLSIDSASTDFAPLLAAFARERRYSGRIGSLSLAGSTRGHSLKQLAEDLELRVNLGPTNLVTESGPMLAADGLTLERKPGQHFSLSAGGDFLSRPFSLKVRAGSDFLSRPFNPEAWAGGAEENQGSPVGSLNLQLEACDTHLQSDITISNNQSDPVAAFKFLMEGKQLCGLLDPVGDFIHQAQDFSVSGKGGFRPGSGFVELAHIRMGNIVAHGGVELTADSRGKTLIEAKLHSDSVDLSPFLPEKATGTANPGDNEPGPAGTPQGDTERGGDITHKIPDEQNVFEILKQLLTMELLPRKRLLASDAVLQFHLGQLETGRGRVSDIKFTANIKDGKLSHSPFQAEIAGEQFNGSAEIDLTGEVPTVNIDLASYNFNLQDLFHEFKLGRSPYIAADQIRLGLKFKGKNVKELLRMSSQKMTIRGGRWEVERKLSEPLQIDIEQAMVSNTQETPTRISLTGTINAEPLSIELTEDGMLAGGTDKPFSIQLTAKLADAALSVDGKVNRYPQKGNKFRLNTTLSGERMNSLNHLFGFDLPPLGPYKFTGSLDNEGDTLNFHDLIVQIGQSALEGAIIISGAQDEKGEKEFPLHLETHLNASSIQLNDFKFGDWSPMKKEFEAEAQTEEGEVPSAGNAQGVPGDKLNNLLSPELAAKIEGTLGIEVGEVLSGNDKLGSGKLKAKLENGRYSLDQLRLDIPGGAAHLQGSLKPETGSIEARLAMQVEHLDYGILIRRAIPDSDIKGEMNLNLDVNSKAETPMGLKEHLNGHLRIGVVPEDQLAGIVDLWAVNILSAALPALLKGKPSEVNCLAGNFTLNDGILQPDIFMLDTTKIRVQGKGTVNFKTNAIDFHMKPTPKSAHFFSLATPVSVTGTITDPHIGVTAGSILKTVFGVVTSVVTAPFQMLFTDSMEPDGKKACSAGMDWVKGNDLNE